jgi:hypothetical protein
MEDKYFTKVAKPHCDHANWRNHRPEDDIEVSGASHKADCSVHYNDPKRLNCNCGLWKAAKPVSDAAVTSIYNGLVRSGVKHLVFDTLKELLEEAADTIEALGRKNERLQSELTNIQLLCTEARAGSPHVYAMNSEKWLMNKILNLLGGSDK